MFSSTCGKQLMLLIVTLSTESYHLHLSNHPKELVQAVEPALVR